VSTPGRTPRWVDLAVVGFAVLAFAPGLGARLLFYDDAQYIYLNGDTLGRPGWEGLLGVWDSSRAWSGRFVEFFPLRDTVYWLVFQQFEVAGLPYHLASLAFHVAASLLLVRVGARVGLGARVSVVAALLFAVHPIHVESVEWASGLKDPMYATFVFASLLAYLRYRDDEKPWRYGLAMALCVCALLVKSMAISLPLLLVACERLVGVATDWKRIAARVAGFAGVCALFTVQFVLIGKANDVVTPPHGGTWASHLVLSAWAQVKYLQQAFFPASFRLIYCFAPPTGLTDARLWGALGVAVAVGVALWLVRTNQRANKAVWLAAIWYVACLVPVSNLIPFPAVMADRYLYAAVWGACVVVALGLEQLRPQVHRVVVGLVLVGLVATSATRSALWNEQENLWAESDEDPACLVDTSGNAIEAHLLRFWSAQDRRVALAAIERSVQMPVLLRSEKLCDTLEAGAFQAVALDLPERGEPWARQASSTPRCSVRPDTWFAMMATTLHRKPEAALDAAERAWRLSRSPRAQVMVGAARLELGRDEGAALVQEAVERSPELACGPLVQWSHDVPTLAPRISGALALCEKQAGRSP
jgi:hypothetical protein